MESYIFGIPVISTNTTGARYLIENNETGFIHFHDDLAGLINSILLVIENPKLGWKMGNRGKNSILKKFNPNYLSKRWVTLLVKQAIKNSKKAHS